MSDEQDRFDANIASYVQAATARAERAEQRLQAAQAEAVVLREALTLAYGVSLPSRWKKWPKSEAKVKAALSGDAGAAYQREHAAMRKALEQLAEHARIAGDANPHCPAFRVIARRARAALAAGRTVGDENGGVE